jgi:hypothetical protein
MLGQGLIERLQEENVSLSLQNITGILLKWFVACRKKGTGLPVGS